MRSGICSADGLFPIAHPANVSVSAAQTGVCWCGHGYPSSLDQKPTRTSAGPIRQAGEADILSLASMDRRLRKQIVYGNLSGVSRNRPETGSDHPVSREEQKSPESDQFCQSQVLSNQPSRGIPNSQTGVCSLSAVNWTWVVIAPPPYSLSS